MTAGSEANRPRLRAVLLLALSLVTFTGCPSRPRPVPERPLPPLVATSVPTPTATPIPAEPSLAPPPASDSLPDHPAPQLAAAARMADAANRLLAEGETDRAIELLEQAIQVEPNAPFAYYGMAEAYLSRRRADEALVLAQRAVTLADGYPAGWAGHAQVLRGRALEQLGERDSAIDAYRRAVEIDPGNIPARAALGRLSRP
jgi:hypothetical protein